MLFFSDREPDMPGHLSNPVNALDNAVLDRIPMPAIPGTGTPDPTEGTGGIPTLPGRAPADDVPVVAVTAIPIALPQATPASVATPTAAVPTSEPSPSPSVANVFVWPVRGAAINVFSADELVYNRTMGDWRVHLGLDIESALGTQVLAMADGTIVDIYDDVFLGTTVVVEHPGGLTSAYSNLMRKPPVVISQQVTAGQVIGGIGQTAEGKRREVNHLHLEMRLNGKPVDPMDYLPRE
jgi:murein DD-endopeptidase MepM/ murein hydrolase activator NlpD